MHLRAIWCIRLHPVRNILKVVRAFLCLKILVTGVFPINSISEQRHQMLPEAVHM